MSNSPLPCSKASVTAPSLSPLSNKALVDQKNTLASANKELLRTTLRSTTPKPAKALFAIGVALAIVGACLLSVYILIAAGILVVGALGIKAVSELKKYVCKKKVENLMKQNPDKKLVEAFEADVYTDRKKDLFYLKLTQYLALEEGHLELNSLPKQRVRVGSELFDVKDRQQNLPKIMKRTHHPTTLSLFETWHAEKTKYLKSFQGALDT
jgi:hypothetical protein